jgi:hypothetical protein
MTAAELQFTLTFQVVYCCHKECGAPIAIPTPTYNRFKSNPSEYFHCCFGHSQHFAGPTEADKLKRELEQERESKLWWQKKADQHSKTVSAFKGQITRIKNRVKNGVCPCCNRTFQNLMRHMQTQHPDFAVKAPESGDET